MQLLISFKRFKLNPKYADAYNGRGNVEKSKGDYDNAIAITIVLSS